MAILQELVDRATDIAAGATDNPMQDAGMLAQSLLPEVFQQVVSKMALDPYQRTIFRRTFDVTMTAGIGQLDPNVLTAYICEAVVKDEDGKYASWLRYDNFINPRDPRIPHFSIKEGTELHYRRVNGTPPYTGNLEVTVVAVTELPAALTDQLEIPEEALNEVIRTLADKMVLAMRQQTRGN